jgi:hypothetical protein
MTSAENNFARTPDRREGTKRRLWKIATTPGIVTFLLSEGRPRYLRAPFRVLMYSTDLKGCAEDAPTVAELDGN